MTTTRTYYNSLIEHFSKICSIGEAEILDYFETKKDISNILARIKKFNLFPLSFTDDFDAKIHSRKVDMFTDEKLSIVNELHFELSECLHTTRLRYGGELMFYIYEIKIALLNLSTTELAVFEKLKKIPQHYFLPEEFIFKNNTEKIAKIKSLRKAQKLSVNKKEKISLKQSDYKKIESTLVNNYSTYKSYIFENYPSIANHFSYYNKKVEVYITQAMSNDIYEFRFHSYSSDYGSSINLAYKYYDFYPAYFYNLEEISEKQYSAHISSLSKTNLGFSDPFRLHLIHWDLVRIFLKNLREKDAVEFASFFLKCEGYKIELSETPLHSFDLKAEKDKKNYFIEIFHRKSRSLENLEERILSIKNRFPEENIIFFFTSFPGMETYDLLKSNEIKFIYVNDLLNNLFQVENSQIVHWYIKSKLSTLEINKEDNIIFQGESLKKKLESCPAGDKHWSEYEEIGIEIFKFLFEDNFKKYITEEQFATDLKNHRRDLIVSNYYKDPSSFWSEVKTEYRCKAIIIDFKNYSDKLNSKTLFSVTKYTNKKVGHFAIVFSRKGVDKTARTEQKSLLNEGKLLIEFNDNELIEMINEKIIGKDPSDRLKSKEFDLIRS